jgi:uncharacterized C2H2 Zn-finger protein
MKKYAIVVEQAERNCAAYFYCPRCGFSPGERGA